jgi:hypothetical protein
MNLRDVSASKYVASDDYPVGYTFPLMTIVRIAGEDVPAPGTNRKSRKAVVYFALIKEKDGKTTRADAAKGWAANTKCLREIGKVLGTTENIDTAWIGAQVQLKVVGDVRRPDGTKGNAIRIAKVLRADGSMPPLPVEKPAPIIDTAAEQAASEMEWERGISQESRELIHNRTDQSNSQEPQQ